VCKALDELFVDVPAAGMDELVNQHLKPLVARKTGGNESPCAPPSDCRDRRD
jgi:hypothetical protein